MNVNIRTCWLMTAICVPLMNIPSMARKATFIQGRLMHKNITTPGRAYHGLPDPQWRGARGVLPPGWNTTGHA